MTSNGTNDPVGPGWWKTKAGWKHWNGVPAGEASPWPQFAIGILAAFLALAIFGGDTWPLALSFVLMGSFGLLSRRVYWSLAVVVLALVLVQGATKV